MIAMASCIFAAEALYGGARRGRGLRVRFVVPRGCIGLKVVVSFWLYFNLANQLDTVLKHKVILQVSGFTLRLTRAAFLFQGCLVSLRVVEEEEGRRKRRRRDQADGRGRAGRGCRMTCGRERGHIGIGGLPLML